MRVLLCAGALALAEAANMIASAQIQVEEAVGELNRFLDHFDADPARLQQLEERLDALYTLARKHRVHPSELADLQQRLRVFAAARPGDWSGWPDCRRKSACRNLSERFGKKPCRSTASGPSFN